MVTNSEKMLLAQQTIDLFSNNKTILRLQYDSIVPAINNTKSIIIGIYYDNKYSNYERGTLAKRLEEEIESRLWETVMDPQPYLENFGEHSSYGFISVDLISLNYNIEFKRRTRNNTPAKASGHLFDFHLNGFD